MANFNDLPVEVFVTIVLSLLSENRISSVHSSLVPLLLVCKRWKRTLQAAPTVWMTINSRDPPSWVNEVIQHSGNLNNLTVVFDRGPNDCFVSQWFADVAASVVHRWKAYVLLWSHLTPEHKGLANSLQTMFQEIARRSASSPAMLRLTVSEPDYPFYEREPLIEAQKLFRLTGPLLSWLTILGGHFPLPPLKDILDVLRATPQLERLTICYPNTTDTSFPREYLPVLLPNLRQFTVKDQIRNVLQIVRYLDLPTVSKYEARVWTNHHNHQVSPAWVPTLRNFTPVLERAIAAIGTTTILQPARVVIHISRESLFFGLEVPAFQKGGNAHSIRFNLATTRCDEYFTHALLQLSPYLERTPVTLWVRSPPSDDTTWGRNILRYIPSLVSLACDGCSCDELLPVLEGLSKDNRALPSLRHLSIGTIMQPSGTPHSVVTELLSPVFRSLLAKRQGLTISCKSFEEAAARKLGERFRSQHT